MLRISCSSHPPPGPRAPAVAVVLSAAVALSCPSLHGLSCWTAVAGAPVGAEASECVRCRNLLEDPWAEPSADMFTRSVSPEQAPDKPTYIEVDFEKGDPVAVDGKKLSPATLLATLNKARLSILR